MPDNPGRGSRNPANGSCDRASALAQRRMSDAVSYAADTSHAHAAHHAANDVRPGSFSRQTVADLIADLHAAVLSPDRGACKPVIARMTGAGIDNHEIAERLFVAEQTVKNRISVIYSKLGVPDRVHAKRHVNRVLASVRGR